jgi:hypothetical protein
MVLQGLPATEYWTFYKWTFMIRRKKDYSKRTGTDQETYHLREWKTASQANAFLYASVAP